MDFSEVLRELGLAGMFTAFGLFLFCVSYVVVEKLAPFDLRKELTEDDNPAVGIMLAGMFIGIGLIIAAAIS